MRSYFLSTPLEQKLVMATIENRPVVVDDDDKRLSRWPQQSPSSKSLTEPAFTSLLKFTKSFICSISSILAALQRGETLLEPAIDFDGLRWSVLITGIEWFPQLETLHKAMCPHPLLWDSVPFRHPKFRGPVVDEKFGLAGLVMNTSGCCTIETWLQQHSLNAEALLRAVVNIVPAILVLDETCPSMADVSILMSSRTEIGMHRVIPIPTFGRDRTQQQHDKMPEPAPNGQQASDLGVILKRHFGDRFEDDSLANPVVRTLGKETFLAVRQLLADPRDESLLDAVRKQWDDEVRKSSEVVVQTRTVVLCAKCQRRYRRMHTSQGVSESNRDELNWCQDCINGTLADETSRVELTSDRQLLLVDEQMALVSLQSVLKLLDDAACRRLAGDEVGVDKLRGADQDLSLQTHPWNSD